MSRIYLSVILLCFIVVPTAFGQQFTLRQWTGDLAKLESQVMKPLVAEFSDQPCQPDIGPYLGAFLERIKVLRGEILSLSYVLLRDVALATGETLGALDDHLSCEEADRWQLVERQIRVHIEHTSNVITQLDGADLL